jgi:hypothetical protein
MSRRKRERKWKALGGPAAAGEPTEDNGREPGRFSARRKTETILRLLRGESDVGHGRDELPDAVRGDGHGVRGGGSLRERVHRAARRQAGDAVRGGEALAAGDPGPVRRLRGRHRAGAPGPARSRQPVRERLLGGSRLGYVWAAERGTQPVVGWSLPRPIPGLPLAGGEPRSGPGIDDENGAPPRCPPRRPCQALTGLRGILEAASLTPARRSPCPLPGREQQVLDESLLDESLIDRLPAMR